MPLNNYFLKGLETSGAMVELVNLTDTFCESSIPSFWQFLRSPYFVFWRSFPKICGNIFISFTWGLFLSPSCEDTYFSPILETFQLNSIGILPPPHSSTMIHLLVEGGKKTFSLFLITFPWWTSSPSPCWHCHKGRKWSEAQGQQSGKRNKAGISKSVLPLGSSWHRRSRRPSLLKPGLGHPAPLSQRESSFLSLRIDLRLMGHSVLLYFLMCSKCLQWKWHCFLGIAFLAHQLEV